jgi:hypothetical protein
MATSVPAVASESIKIWDEFLAIPDLSASAIARMVKEALDESDFEGVRYALTHPKVAGQEEVCLTVAPTLARTLRNLECDAQWRDGEFAGRIEDSLTEREKQVWQLCDEWLASLPRAPDGVKSKVLAKCLKAAATGYNPGAVDFFLKRGAKFLKAEPGAMRAPLFAAFEDTTITELANLVLPHLGHILPHLSFDVVDLAIAKQRGLQVKTVADLYDKDKTQGAVMTDTAFYLRDLATGVFEIGSGTLDVLKWIDARIPATYRLPYNQLWDHAAGVAENLANLPDDNWGSKEVRLVQDLAHLLTFGAQPAGDVNEQSQAWHALLSRPIKMKLSLQNWEPVTIPAAFLIATFDRVKELRQDILGKAFACGGWDVNEVVNGRALLHCAIEWAGDEKRADFVSFLLHAGANPDLKSGAGLSPSELAGLRGQDEIVQMIASWRARQAVAGVLDRVRQVQHAGAQAGAPAA